MLMTLVNSQLKQTRSNVDRLRIFHFCSTRYMYIIEAAAWAMEHCCKYFSPRSKFGTKNPKLGSNNPFVLSVNCVPIFGLTMIKIVG